MFTGLKEHGTTERKKPLQRFAVKLLKPKLAELLKYGVTENKHVLFFTLMIAWMQQQNCCVPVKPDHTTSVQKK